MRKHFKYARYLFWHKWYVFTEGLNRGLFWRVIIHDWDKFLPSRWLAYANWFEGIAKTPEIKKIYMASWRGHVNRNDHHYQHWVAYSDKGQITLHEMSEKARVEMLCDWISAHRTLHGTVTFGDNKETLLDWYRAREETIPIAPKTKRWIRDELQKL